MDEIGLVIFLLAPIAAAIYFRLKRSAGTFKFRRYKEKEGKIYRLAQRGFRDWYGEEY